MELESDRGLSGNQCRVRWKRVATGIGWVTGAAAEWLFGQRFGDGLAGASARTANAAARGRQVGERLRRKQCRTERGYEVSSQLEWNAVSSLGSGMRRKRWPLQWGQCGNAAGSMSPVRGRVSSAQASAVAR